MHVPLKNHTEQQQRRKENQNPFTGSQKPKTKPPTQKSNSKMNSQPSFNDMTTLVSQASLTASTSIGSASSTQTFYYGVPTASNSSMDLLEDDDELFVNPTVEDFMTMDKTKTYWETLSEFSR